MSSHRMNKKDPNVPKIISYVILIISETHASNSTCIYLDLIIFFKKFGGYRPENLMSIKVSRNILSAPTVLLNTHNLSRINVNGNITDNFRIFLKHVHHFF